METITYQNSTLTLDVYQTDDLRKWTGIYLHACRSRNLATGTIEFYDKKINTFVQFCLGHDISNICVIWSKVSTESGTSRPGNPVHAVHFWEVSGIVNGE
jgi:hypothetical protein